MGHRVDSLDSETSARCGRAQCGFTLVEMLTVITIIALLLAITIPSIGRMRISAMRGMSLSTIASINTACELYNEDFGEYPPSDPGIPAPAWIKGMQGRQMLVQWLTGYKDGGYVAATGALTGDGQSGYGFRLLHKGKLYGPYNDTDKIARSTTNPPAFVDSFGEEIYYYRFDTRKVGNNIVTGYFSTDNSGTKVPPMPTVAYRDAGKKIFFRQDFILLSAGADGRFTSFTDVTNKGYQTDDITNFLPE